AQLASDKYGQTEKGEGSQNNDEVRSEPVFFLSFVEHDLQRADAYGQQSHAPIIDPSCFALDVGRVEDKGLRHQQGDDANRNIDVEHQTPAITIGQLTSHAG